VPARRKPLLAAQLVAWSHTNAQKPTHFRVGDVRKRAVRSASHARTPPRSRRVLCRACAGASITRSLLTGLGPLSQRGETLYKGHPSSVARALSTPNQRYVVYPYIPPRHTPPGSAAGTTPAPAFPTEGVPHARMARQVAARAAAKRIGRFDCCVARWLMVFGAPRGDRQQACELFCQISGGQPPRRGA